MLKEIIKRQLSDSRSTKSLIYCIDITLKTGRILHLTNASKALIAEGEKYLPNSGLEIEEIYFDDSGDNHILISGIYEKNGIQIEMDLIDAKFSVNLFSRGELHNLVIYSCSEFTRGDLDFLIRLESQIHKYNKQAALIFSKTCRANLGDAKCKVDIESLAEYYQIDKIEGRNLYLKDTQQNQGQQNQGQQSQSHQNQGRQSEAGRLKRSGYFTAGKVILISEQEEELPTTEIYFIVSHHANKIVLGKNISPVSQNASVAKILPGCDKKFITCCKKFDNALNFRGEPFVPEFNKLEN